MKRKLIISILTGLLLISCVNAQGTTPSQQEGPYYPVEKLDDRDNDLTVVEGSNGLTAGDLLFLRGNVLDSGGQPISGAVVEIWQTDASGAYMHPNDPATVNRDMNFQFYGESVTGEDGGYSFRTILPGQYEPRPRHIYFKIKLNSVELLTSQLYFEGYEGAETAREPALLTVTLNKITDDNYATAYDGSKDIVLARD